MRPVACRRRRRVAVRDVGEQQKTNQSQNNNSNEYVRDNDNDNGAKGTFDDLASDASSFSSRKCFVFAARIWRCCRYVRDGKLIGIRILPRRSTDTRRCRRSTPTSTYARLQQRTMMKCARKR